MASLATLAQPRKASPPGPLPFAKLMSTGNKQINVYEIRIFLYFVEINILLDYCEKEILLVFYKSEQ